MTTCGLVLEDDCTKRHYNITYVKVILIVKAGAPTNHLSFLTRKD
jgi:hypothetical protein